jgi:hypothetical protein
MRRSRIVVAAVVVFVVALGTGAYLWVQAVFVLPGASCGEVYGLLSGQTRLTAGAPRAPQCFLAAVRTCASAGIRVHTQGVETSIAFVFIVDAGGVPGRCRVTEYSQEGSYLGIGTVNVTGCQEESVTGKGVMLSCPNLSGPALIPPVVTTSPPTSPATFPASFPPTAPPTFPATSPRTFPTFSATLSPTFPATFPATGSTASRG